VADLPVPTFCRLEYLTPAGWATGHAGIALLHPRRYVERLAKRGKIGRVTLLDTGEIIQLACEFCSEVHDRPGTCLI
jgi:hypothetical protein